MFVAIFGRPNCPYCDKAKDLAEQLKLERADFNYTYVNIVEAGISKEDLCAKAGKPVETVPQIFIGQEHLGGFTEMDEYFKSV